MREKATSLDSISEKGYSEVCRAAPDKEDDGTLLHFNNLSFDESSGEKQDLTRCRCVFTTGGNNMRYKISAECRSKMEHHKARYRSNTEAL